MAWSLPVSRARKSMSRPAQLRVNIITSLGSTLLSAVVMAVAYPLYLHFLGFEQYGLWLVLSTVITMAQVGNFGVSPALLTLVAEDYGAGNIDGVYRYISGGMLSLLASGIVLISGVLLLRHPIVALFGVTGPDARTAYVLLPYVAVLSVYLLMADAMNSVLAGVGRYDLVSYSQLLGQAITVVISVVLLELHYGIWSLLIANAVSALFLNVVSLALVRRITRSGSWIRFTLDRGRLRRILNFGSWVFGSSIVNTAINPLNKLFITRFAGIGAVPVYDISFAVSMKIRSLVESGFRSLTPEFSRLNSLRPQDAYDRLAAADRKGAKVVLYGGTLIYLVVFALSGWGLALWLGARSTPSLPGVFRIIFFGTYISLWGVQSWYSLLGFGRSRHIFLTSVAQAVANISFVLLWRPSTLTSVAVGTSVGMLAAAVYLRWQNGRLRRDLASDANGAGERPGMFGKDLAIPHAS